MKAGQFRESDKNDDLHAKIQPRKLRQPTQIGPPGKSSANAQAGRQVIGGTAGPTEHIQQPFNTIQPRSSHQGPRKLAGPSGAFKADPGQLTFEEEFQNQQTSKPTLSRAMANKESQTTLTQFPQLTKE